MMPLFKYQALTPLGELVSGEIAAPHKSEVAKRIEFLGLIPIETSSAESSGKFADFFQRDLSMSDLFTKPVSADDVTLFSRDLATLLESEIRIDQALDLLSDPQMSGRLSPVVLKLRADVGAGETLADALERHPDLFPPVYLALVRIGESSGSLAGVISSLAEERARMSLMRRKVLDALRYPAFILGAAWAVLVFFLLFVLPQFSVVLQDLGTRMDPIVRALLGLSAFVNENGRFILTGAIVLATGLFVALRTPGIRDRLAGASLRAPGLKSISVDYRTAIFCRSLGVLMRNGVRLTTALGLVVDAVSDAASAAKWSRVRERVRHGSRLYEALVEADEISPIAIRMLRIGEESGHLPELAVRAADFFETRVERRIGKVVAIIGPAAILLIAVVVGGLVVSLMTSLVSIGQLAN